MTNNKDERQSLNKLRQQIDDIDLQLLHLFSERAKIAQAIAKVKQDAAGTKKPMFYRPEREAQVLRRMVYKNPGPLSSEAIQRFFREIMSSCLSLQQSISVAYLGPEGTFTQQATLNYFGVAADSCPYASIDDVFRAVATGTAHYGVVPVENSIEGFVNHTLDNFFLSPQKICGEVILRIHHNFMVSTVSQGKEIQKIYAHSQALAQCRHWLDRHYPNAKTIAVSSNGEAAHRVSEQKKAGCAAIASDMAAELYGLTILSAKIEDLPDNSTRFLILGNHVLSPTGDDKTSLIVVSPDEPGSLHRILAPFHCYGVNLTKLESQPIRKSSWRYAFFIDLDGHKEDAKVKQALKDIEDYAVEVSVLGSYPRVVL